jgi:hypothetical protein
MLNGVRAVLETEVRARAGRPRVTWQLEDADPHALELYRALVHDPTSQALRTPEREAGAR